MAKTSDYMDAVLTANGSSDEFIVNGNCDVWISGYSSGAVKLQIFFKATAALTSPTWMDVPDGSFTADTYKTIFISAKEARVRFTGVSNAGGEYVRIDRHTVR